MVDGTAVRGRPEEMNCRRGRRRAVNARANPRMAACAMRRFERTCSTAICAVASCIATRSGGASEGARERAGVRRGRQSAGS